ncbi:MAG: hypothetical protein KGH89_06910 [Thaumarchaeota archaeon]|nr:hypothetical protein [Nitrososphaerota archaeon]MDE1867472.1 hypothetical protein [Nitrososphaerota archaeon]
MQKKYLLLVVYFSFFVGLVTYEIMHPPFSTDAAKVGNYQVEVSTTPSVPDIGKDTKIHFLVLDQNGAQVDKIRMGLQIYHDDELTKEFPPDNYPGIWDVDYVFQEPGNHVFRITLFDMHTGDVNSYAFNITTLSLYTSIFVVLVIAGVGGASGIVIAIWIFAKRTRPSFRY